MDSADNCEHNWQFQHTVWKDATNECLEQKDVNKRVYGNSYHSKPDGVMPA